MTSPELMRRLGIRDPESIAKQMQTAMQQKTLMEQGVAGRSPPLQTNGQQVQTNQSIPGTAAGAV